MRALITGAAGFVGRHMAAELRARGWNVEGFDLKPGHGSGWFYGDVRDINGSLEERATLAHVARSTFDLVVHCAYQVGGRATIDGVPMALAHNLAADAALFEWALTTGQRRVLYFSSSAAYPAQRQGRAFLDLVKGNEPDYMFLLDEDLIDLNDAAEPDANYGWAKLTGERLARAAATQGLAVHVVRPASGYGSDQGEEYPFPALLRRVLRSNHSIQIWGDVGQVRDWIHIDDVVRGALAVVDADERRPVNLATGKGTSMEDLVWLMWTAARPAEAFPGVHARTDKPMGVFYRVLSPERLREHYIPQVAVEAGIRRAIDTIRPSA